MREPDAFARAQSEEAIALYKAYRAEHDRSEIAGRFMPYRWWTLPDPIGGLWMPYVEMLGDYAPELANVINDLTHDVHRLYAWARDVERRRKAVALYEVPCEIGVRIGALRTSRVVS